MSQYWAAREGDALEHSTFMADVISAGISIGGNMLLMGAALQLGFSGIGCILVGAVGGLVSAFTGASAKISEFADDVGNRLFPPTIQAHIRSGSDDTHVNGKHAARAAGSTPPWAEMMAAQSKPEVDAAAQDNAKAERSIVDTAKSFFKRGAQFPDDHKTDIALALTGPIGAGILTARYANEIGNFLGELISEMWRPTVAMPVKDAIPKPNDKILCSKHPASLTESITSISNDFSTSEGITNMLAMPPFGFSLITGFKLISGLFGSAEDFVSSHITHKEVDTAERMAEGARDIWINGQPAVRSGDRSTCEAKVVSDPAGGTFVSDNVRIGGPSVAVRSIKSGKYPIEFVADIAMAFVGEGPICVKLACYLAGVGIMGLISKAATAVMRPVHAATGAKYLRDDELDFSIPFLMPLTWQRLYNSRDERSDGLFGAGWSVPFEVSLENTPGAGSADYQTYVDDSGRRLELDAVAPGGGFHNGAEGLTVRRHNDGQWMIITDDGEHRLFEPDPHRPGFQRLILIGDRNRNALELEYDADGRLSRMMDSNEQGGIALHYDSGHSRRVTQIDQLYGYQQSKPLCYYAYNDKGDLITVFNSDRSPVRHYGYDEGRRINFHRLPSGLECHYRWAWMVGPDDSAWRVVEHTTNAGEHYWLDYRLAERTLVVRDGLGRQSTRRWNASSLVTYYCNEVGEEYHLRWNDRNLLIGVTEPNGGEWRYVYDRAGHLVETHDSMGRVSQAVWDPVWHLPSEEISPSGQRWQYQYDPCGNLITSIDPLGFSTQYQYDLSGLPICVTDAKGGINHLRWNTNGQLQRHQDCSGNLTYYYYTPDLKLDSVTNAEGETTRYRYFNNGQLQAVITQDGRETQYSARHTGQVDSIRDPAGAITRFEYNVRGQITRRFDAENRQTGYEYDSYGRLTTLSNENGEHYRFIYDNGDRLICEIDITGRKQKWQYNSAGDIVSTRYAADTPDEIEHRFSYDLLGQRLSKHTPDSRTQYEYNDDGRLLCVARRPHDVPPDAEADTIRFSYDVLGRMVSETTDKGTLRYEYDALGNCTGTTLPDGRTIQYLYYGSGHLHQINLDGDVISDFERDRLHREIRRTQGKLDTRFQFDNSGRLIRSKTSRVLNGNHSQVHIERSYLFDRQDNLIRQNHSRYSTTRYEYDRTGRAIGSHSDYHLERYQYDPAGNRLGSTHENQFSQHVRGNQIEVCNGNRYRYDAHGRTIEKRGKRNQRYRYDSEHRLIEVISIDRNRRYGYRYDPLGRRVAKFEYSQSGKPINTTRFLWDGLRLLQETSSGNERVLYFYNGPEGYTPLARQDENESSRRRYYYHTSINGAPEELTDNDGEIVWDMVYDLWGNAVRHTVRERVQQNLRYQGQYLDEESGLHYNTFRYYDPDVGRFTTTDPIGLLGGVNLYQYAPNALAWVDPWGWECLKIKRLGDAREKRVIKRLRSRFGKDYLILTQRYLRNSAGKIVRGSNGKGRILDVVMVDKNGKAVSIEITSRTAKKADQLHHELEILEMGGTYVRIPRTKKLIEVRRPSREIRVD